MKTLRATTRTSLFLSLALLAGASFALFAGVALAQEANPAPDQNAMMQAWMEAATPDAHHAQLAAFAGEWNFTSRMWETPAAKPTVSTGTCTKKMIFGGRYLQEELHGEMMGMPFEGLGITGYNKLTGNFETVWLDNMGTAISYSTGSAEGDSVFVSHMTVTDPLTHKSVQAKLVTRLINKDKHVFTWYNLIDGREVKSMEMEYLRK